MNEHKIRIATGVIVGSFIIAAVALLLLGGKKDKPAEKTVNPTQQSSVVLATKLPAASGANTPTRVDESEIITPGQYTDYDSKLLASGKNVLFFYASWCPTCRQADENIKNEVTDIPEDVNILITDYDKESELKKKYGVTYQHTFVQVDKDGNLLKKWSGSYTISDIVNELI